MSSLSIIGFSERYKFDKKRLKYMQNADYNLITIANSYGDLVNDVIEYDPDVVVVDLGRHGFQSPKAKMLENVLSGFHKCIVVVSQTRDCHFKVSYYVSSHFWKAGLVRALSTISKHVKPIETPIKQKTVKSVITETLIRYSFSPAHLGFNYLSLAIEIWYNARGFIKNLGEEVYQKIADTYKTNAKNVERNIRHAISCSSKEQKGVILTGSNRKVISTIANQIMFMFKKTPVAQFS